VIRTGARPGRPPAGQDGGDGRALRTRRAREARGRGRNAAAGVGGAPVAVQARTADIRDRDGAPDVILDMLEKAPKVRRVWADSGHGGERLRETLAGTGVPDAPGIVRGPDGTGGFTVPCRRWVVVRTFAWMSRCRRLGRDSGRSLESSVAWARPGACRFPVRRLARGAGGREQKEYPEQ